MAGWLQTEANGIRLRVTNRGRNSTSCIGSLLKYANRVVILSRLHKVVGASMGYVLRVAAAFRE